MRIKAPSFSAAPVEKYYEAPLPAEKLTVDQAAWEKRLNRKFLRCLKHIRYYSRVMLV